MAKEVEESLQSRQKRAYLTNDLSVQRLNAGLIHKDPSHRTNLMNEPKHIKEVVIRMLKAQIQVVTIEIDDLMAKKAPWNEIERLMDKRDELATMLNNFESDQQNDGII